MSRSCVVSILVVILCVAVAYSAPDKPDGFASISGNGLSTTTGGEGGETVTVTSWSDLKKYAESSDPYIILVEGTIYAPSKGDAVEVQSNKTIVGLGDNATLKEAELIILYKENIIIRNLTIRDSYLEGDEAGKENDYDAIQADGTHHLWIDHCHFTHCGDGLIDLRKVTDNVTVSWTELSNHNKAFGIGWTDETDFRITIHHCWFNETNQRNPAFDNGIGHLYNNYVKGVTSYGHHARGRSTVIIENCYFKDSNDPVKMDNVSKCYLSGAIYSGCSGPSSGNVSSKPYTVPYDYTLDPTSEINTIVPNGVGPQARIGDQYTGGAVDYDFSVSVAQGQGTITPQSGSYNEGHSVTVTANPADGWLFDHWGGDLSGSTNPATVSMDGDKSVSAYFIEDPRTFHTVAALAEPGGIITQEPEGAELVEGTNVSFTAIPNTGWTFNGWTGDHSGTDATYTVSSLSSNIAVTASFIPVDKLNYEAEGGQMRDAEKGADNGGFSGEGYVNFLSIEGSSVDIPVYADNEGEMTVTITFANGSDAPRSLSISVNGTPQIGSIDFEATGGWGVYQTKQISLTFDQGPNTITLETFGTQDGPNLDKISFNSTSIAAFGMNAGQASFSILANNSLSIRTAQSNNVHVSVFSLNGKEVFTQNFHNASKVGKVDIPLTSLGSGVYFLSFKYDGNVKTGYINLFRH